ncbi:ImuA family protein [Flavihumibacter petaseus]|nr:hypothetical protein [Flavihumibacter petaseus]
MTLPDDTIISRLKQQIRIMEGTKPSVVMESASQELGDLPDILPGHVFPYGGMHEWLVGSRPEKSASAAFIAAILAPLLQKEGTMVWIGLQKELYPPALVHYGIRPDKVLFIHPANEKDLFWVTEEALKCRGFAAVVAELPELTFTASRRMQLAVESSKVTGCILHPFSDKLPATACISRWRIKPVTSHTPKSLPGIGFPQWQVDLLKVRQGVPRQITLCWKNQRFHAVEKESFSMPQIRRKTG